MNVSDSIDRALREGVLEPTREFSTRLESLLDDAYEGGPNQSRPHMAPRRRVLIALVAAVIAALGIGAFRLARQPSSHRVIAPSPETAVDPPSTTGPGPTTATMPSIVTTTSVTPVTVVPAMSTPDTASNPANVSSTTTETSAESTLNSTTVPSTPSPSTEQAAATEATVAPGFVDVAVDFAIDATPITPTSIGQFASGFVYPASGDRIVVALDDVVIFLNASGTEISRFTWPAVANRYVFGIGPDDILYVNEPPRSEEPTRFVAYAPIDGAYTEVASVPHYWGDVPITLEPTGIYLYSPTDGPIEFKYVDATGAPSGATLPIGQLVVDDQPSPDLCDVTASAGEWRLHVLWSADRVPDETVTACFDVREGPAGSAVATFDEFGEGADHRSRIAVLAATPTVYDADGWRYRGILGDRLLLVRSDAGNQTTEIGLFGLPAGG